MRSKRKNALTKHLLKIISILCSAIIWFYVLSSEPYEIEKKFKVDFILPIGTAISSNEIPSEVLVNLKGPRMIMKDISTQNEKILINLTDYLYQFNRPFKVLVNQKDIHVPFGIDVVKITPSQFNIILDKKIIKKVSIKPTFMGEIKDGYRLLNYHIQPKEVLIEGPKEVMRKTWNVYTSIINLEELMGMGKTQIGITSKDSRVRILESSQVDFHYEIRPKKANITIDHVRIRFLASHRRYITQNRYVSLDVLAPKDVKNKLKISDIQVIADIPEDTSGMVRIKLKAILPPDVHLLQIRPEYITVRGLK